MASSSPMVMTTMVMIRAVLHGSPRRLQGPWALGSASMLTTQQPGGGPGQDPVRSEGRGRGCSQSVLTLSSVTETLRIALECDECTKSCASPEISLLLPAPWTAELREPEFCCIMFITTGCHDLFQNECSHTATHLTAGSWAT